MSRLIRQLLIVSVLGGGATFGAAALARSSFMMDRELHEQVSVRQANPMAGRLILGGGLRGGK
ncbi:MAG: hypothetical protein AAGA48_05910 [Myxococcota bacterium]